MVFVIWFAHLCDYYCSSVFGDESGAWEMMPVWWTAGCIEYVDSTCIKPAVNFLTPTVAIWVQLYTSNDALFDIRAALSYRVPGCQKLQMMVWHMMLYSWPIWQQWASKGWLCRVCRNVSMLKWDVIELQLWQVAACRFVLYFCDLHAVRSPSTAAASRCDNTYHYHYHICW